MPISLDSQTRSPVVTWGFFLLLSGVLLLLYSPALNGEFVWDDDAWTTEMAQLNLNVGGLWRIWTEPTALQQYYPVTGTSFWLDHQLWGDWTLPYHVENVLLHAACAVLLWRLLVRLNVPGAALAGLIFALHPVMVESVAWVTERKNVLSLALMLAAFLAHKRWEDGDRGWKGYMLILILFTLSLLSKITAFVFAPSLLLLAWWKRGHLQWRRDVLPSLPFWVITLALGAVIWWLETHHVGAKGRDFSSTPVQRIISAGHVFWFYPWKLLWPVGLSFIYPDWRSGWQAGSMPWWQWLWPASVVVVLGSLWLARGRTGRGLLACVLFYLGGLVPVCGLMNVYGGLFSPVWDHWVYVPALGILIPAAVGVQWLAASIRRPWALPALASTLLIPMSLQIWQLSHQYQNKETLWVETIRRNPNAWLALNNHGAFMVDAGKLEDGIHFFKEATRANPGYAEAWNNLVQLGRHQESLPAYRKAIAADSNIAPFTRHNMGNALLALGRGDEAMEQFYASLAMKPDYHEAHNSLGAALIQAGRVDEAIEHLREALRLYPTYYQAQNNLGTALQKKGDLDGARACYEKTIQLAPKFVEARFNLGELRHKQGDPDAAKAIYREIISLLPDNAKAYYNLALVLSSQDQLAEADPLYRQAIGLAPGYASAHNNLASNLLKEGNTAEAVDHLKKALSADPGHLAAMNNMAWVLATDTDSSLRDGRQALELAQKAAELTRHEHPMVLSTLAAALAETGDYGKAVEQAHDARALALRQGDSSLATSLDSYMQLYQSGQPLRVKRGP
jgi:tetratricopeptide (TPR) repeat protein